MMTKQKSDLSRAFAEDGERKTHVGGQALIEGVMMRGKYNWAVAVREPSGQIYTEEHDLASGKQKNRWMSWPLIRGCVALVESLALGYKALEVATMHAYDAEGETYHTLSTQGAGAMPRDDIQSPCDNPADDNSVNDPHNVPKQGGHAGEAQNSCVDEEKGIGEDQSFLGKAGMSISLVLGVVLGVALFIVVPAFITNLLVGEYDEHTILWNVVDGVLRVGVFVFYIWLIGCLKDIKRMFSYHGAEHKTIHCYEHGMELTPENARSFPRLHIRCGTAFLIMVMVVAILVYTIIPLNPLISAWGVPDGASKLLLVIVVRIVFMPVIAGISYEITVKWAGTHPDNALVKVILWPGMQMQYLTTNEPDEGMIECAIASMKIVLAREERELMTRAESTNEQEVCCGSDG